MELLALLSNRDDLMIPDVKESIKKYTVYPLKTVEELEDLNSNIPLSLVIIDTVSHGLSSVRRVLDRLDDDMVVLITPEKLDRHELESLPPSVYDTVGIDSLRTELPVVVERAIEKQRFRSEIRMLKRSRNNNVHHRPAYAGVDGEVFSGRESFPSGKYLPKRVLVNFAKMLTASFDMRKLFNHFMDSVMEIARVSKMSIMLREEDIFYMKTHYGLDPYIAENLRLKKDSALVAWLARHGRIMHKPADPSDTQSMRIRKEMDLLQCSFSFPMTYKGRLIGIFNIDNKITDEPFYKEELEIIYVLCNYLAAAVRDIDLYHQIWYQKEFTKNILSSMKSGMIAIDKDERITIFNQQAGEILGLDPSKMVGHDLRRLPSPLGDILYETMVTGASYRRHEIEILPSRIPLGINSYRLLDEHQNPAGAGIVFTDLSDSRRLEQEIRRSERLEAVNQLMAKIAHEIRNPLTSVQTYTQLINEKYRDDPELQEFYLSSVSRSIQKLDTLIDRLVTFSMSQEYNFESLQVNILIEDISDFLAKNIKQGYNFIKQEIEPSLLINADKKLLIKAVYYVVAYIISKVDDDVPVVVKARTVMEGLPFLEIRIEFEGGKFTEEDRKDMLRPLTEIEDLETGLNIPISQKILRGHKGSFDMRSEEGKEVFIMNIPAIDRRSS